MHSSRMRTARSRSHQLGVYLSACWDTPLSGPGDPPGVGLENPPGVGLETSPWPDPSTFPLGCGSGDLPLARPLNFPPEPRNLQGMLGYPLPLDTCKASCDTTWKACWDTHPPLSGQNDRHM